MNAPASWSIRFAIPTIMPSCYSHLPTRFGAAIDARTLVIWERVGLFDDYGSKMRSMMARRYPVRAPLRRFGPILRLPQHSAGADILNPIKSGTVGWGRRDLNRSRRRRSGWTRQRDGRFLSCRLRNWFGGGRRWSWRGHRDRVLQCIDLSDQRRHLIGELLDFRLLSGKKL
jgi:hypothetical protein